LIREQILPQGLNTALVCTEDGLVPCWNFRTPSREIRAFSLNVLVLKVQLFGSAEDAEVLQDEIDLFQITQEDLDLFAAQDEEYLLNT
jgi:hypothetical protein